MKSHSLSSSVTFGTVAALLSSGILTTSCIFDSPCDDEFYSTLWESDEIPLGPFDVSSMTLEFLCNECVEIKTIGNSRTIYGTYAFDGMTATFNDLTLYLNMTDTEGETIPGDYTVTFLEAHRNGDTLFLLWRVENMLHPFTTALHRLPAYE
jgi:hypothetical protein